MWTGLQVVGKIGVIVAYGRIIMTILNAKKLDQGIKFNLDLVSMMTVYMTLGLGLVSLVAVFDSTTAMFGFMLSAISIILSQFQLYRFVFVGNRYALITGRTVERKNIRFESTNFFGMTVKVEGKARTIYVPLTTHDDVAKLVK